MISRILVTLLISLVVVATLGVGCAQPAAPTPTSSTAKAPTPTQAAKPAATVAPAASPRAEAPTTSKPAAPAAKPLSPPVSVKIGILGIIPDAGIFIAQERGYFNEEGLDVQLVNFVSGAEVIPPLATGELQFGTGSVNPGFFNAVARGLDLRIVASKSVVAPQLAGGGLIARKDLYDSGQLKDLSQLKGKTIALNLKATTSELYVERILEKGGVKLSEVNLVEMPFPDMAAALGNKAIDAAWTVEPFIGIPIQRGLAARLIPLWDIYPDHVTSVVMISPVFAKDQPEAAKRFITAYLRGQRDAYNAIAKRNAPPEPIFDILTKYTPIKDPAMYKALQLDVGDPNGYFKTELLANDQDYYAKKGYVPQKVDVSKLVDFQYVEYALQRLGKLN